MTIALEYWYNHVVLGAEGLLNSFFATVCMRLEGGVWGSRFPVVMHQLYWGRVEVESLQWGVEELEVIKREFLERPVDDAVWVTGEENTHVEPSYIVTRGEHAHNLFEYFTTADQALLLDRLIRVFTKAKNLKGGQVVKITGSFVSA